MPEVAGILNILPVVDYNLDYIQDIALVDRNFDRVLLQELGCYMNNPGNYPLFPFHCINNHY